MDRDVNAPLFDLDGVDRTARLVDREGLRRWLPQRGVMQLLDAVIWQNDELTRAVGVKHVREDEFWVPGHFPDRALLPGVLMIETGAQLACYLFNVRRPDPQMAAFLRIEHAAFRSSAVPGDDLIVLCEVIKLGRRRFITDIQGLVGDRIAYESRISGMMIGPMHDSPA